MPVQDNEDKRTNSEPMVDAEEELRKQIAANQENENSVQKSGKLLPFLNAKAEHHQSRINTIDSKIATQQDKIAKHEAKIEQLSAKADKLEDTNRMLRATLGNFPIVRKAIEANVSRIASIRNEKIPNRQQKLENCKAKVEQLSDKREVISHKLNRVVALNDTIKSFSIGANSTRREAFAAAMDSLNNATVNCLLDKRDSLAAKKDDLIQAYNDPATSVVDKYNLQAKIDSLTTRIDALETKVEKFDVPIFFSEQLGQSARLDAAMQITADKLGEMTEKGDISLPELAEEAVTAGRKIDGMELSEIEQLAEKLGIEPLHKVEEQVEDDLNMIDGIINNGTKSDLDKAKAELLVGIKSMEELASNPFVPKDMHDMAVQNLAQMQEQLSAVDEALAKFDAPLLSPDALDEINAEELMAESEDFAVTWLQKMIDEGKAEFTEDGGFKVNADYYKNLPRNDRHIETMTEAQSVAVMSALSAAGIEFSAASKGEDKVGITVSKKDLVALNDIMQDSIGKTVQMKATKSQEKEEHYQTVNPDYYKSLPKDQRHTRVEPIDVARKIVSGLQKENIPYSAVVRKNDTVAVTVSKDNAQAYKQIESAVKGERAVQLINPEFFKALPKQERFTQRMTEDQARAKSAELDKKGIEHSAVLGGDKSAVTVAKKDSRTAFFSRSKLKRDVQRLNGQGKPSPERQQTPKKRENQGLD